MATERTTTSPSAGPDATAKSNQKSMAANMALPQKALEANLETGSELLTFMSRRLKAQAELWHEFSTCHGIGEVAEVQRKFLARITKDYSDEMAQLAEIAKKNFESVTQAAMPTLRTNGTVDDRRSQ